MIGIIDPKIQSYDDGNLPFVILWSPYITHPNKFPVKCVQCGEYLYHSYWNDGSSTAKQPRMLHGISDIVLLVSAAYSCSNRHRILAHDQLILKLVPSSNVPFCLLHQTGFTKDLVDTCTTFCKQGINFYCMETLILERRWQTFARRQEELPSTNDFWASSISKSPSNDILAKCFLAGFLCYENIYLHEMRNIDVSDSISFDHTFKIASNLGYLRQDRKWINEYDSLLLVLNNAGKVIAWQLTKGTSFLQAEKLFLDIEKRSNGKLRTVYVDDCCKQRNKIQEIFGIHVSVKLDLFHAVQRITKTISKKHPYFNSCIQDLRLVFRRKGDCEEKRLSHTSCSDEIGSNLDSFVEKWKNAAKDGNQLFKTDTIKAIENLKKHINNDCLSDIPPGGGTNKNE